MFEATFTAQNRPVAIGPFTTFAELETAAKSNGVFCETRTAVTGAYPPGDPNYPRKPGDPNYPGKPGDPNYPGKPGDPNYPGKPGDPNYPGDPRYAGTYSIGGNVRTAPAGPVVGTWRDTDAGVAPRDYANPGMGKYGSGLPGSNPGDPNDSSNMETGPAKDRKIVEERAGTGHYPATDIHKTYPAGDPRYAGSKPGDPNYPGKPGDPGYPGSTNPGDPSYLRNPGYVDPGVTGKPASANPLGKYSASFTLNGVAQTIGPFSSFTAMSVAGQAKGAFCASGQADGDVRQTNINGDVVGHWTCS